MGRAFRRTKAGRAVWLALASLIDASAEIDRLTKLLATMTREYQNLVAAARAALAARDEAEDDPLYYLRDELHAQGQIGSGSAR